MINFNELLTTKADLVVVAARNNSKHIDRYAKEFFKTANETGQQSNAIVALHSAINKADAESFFQKVKNIFMKKPSLKEIIVNSVDSSLSKNQELEKEFDTFCKSLKEKYPRTLEDRFSIAEQGAVRANKVHKPTITEKFLISINKMIREE